MLIRVQKNLDAQLKTTGGTGRRFTGGLSQSAQTDKNHYGFSEVFSVDTALEVNSVNTISSQGYFQTVVNSLLSPLDHMSSDGTICKCISVVRYGRHNVGIVQPSTVKDDSDHIVPNSGATSHMQQNISNFEDTYVTCNNVFVLMGDNLEIPVLSLVHFE